MGHNFFFFFSRMWWLIFPLFWMCAMMAGLWSRHARANRALDILQSYVTQGKEPPPEVLAMLQNQNWGPGFCGGGGGSALFRWRQFFFFAALACAFGFMAFWWPWMAGYAHPYSNFGLVMVTAVMAALALASLFSALLRPRNTPSDKNGMPR